MSSAKKEYTMPALTIYGNLEVLTQGGKDGEQLDASFPVNTPKGKLTFS
ncbi:hypothetical protein [Crinalium epipsammum]|nr:hypothetical protein [Crinalium epipsammum]